MVHNKSLIFASIPTGYPIPGKDLIVKESELDLDSVPEGGIILKNFYVSLDPYQRGRMRPVTVKSYNSAFPLNSIMTNQGISQVVKSADPGFEVGELVLGHIGTENFSVISKERRACFSKVDNKYNLPLSYFVGALGMPGLTAYSSFYEIGKPKKGETIFISAASGAVGQLVGQIAKHEGLRVIGSVGSQEKVSFIKRELKFDEAFNYNAISNDSALKILAPNGIDIYFENVGGEALEAALAAANDHSRFIMCGMISYYNEKSKDEMYLPSNIVNIVAKRIKLQGFVVSDPEFVKYAGEQNMNVSKWLNEGEIVAKETFSHGVENAAKGFVDMLQGRNLGKAVVKLMHDE